MATTKWLYPEHSSECLNGNTGVDSIVPLGIFQGPLFLTRCMWLGSFITFVITEKLQTVITLTGWVVPKLALNEPNSLLPRAKFASEEFARRLTSEVNDFVQYGFVIASIFDHRRTRILQKKCTLEHLESGSS